MSDPTSILMIRRDGPLTGRISRMRLDGGQVRRRSRISPFHAQRSPSLSTSTPHILLPQHSLSHHTLHDPVLRHHHPALSFPHRAGPDQSLVSKSPREREPHGVAILVKQSGRCRAQHEDGVIGDGERDETIPPLERISRVMVSRAGRAGSTHSETGLPAEFVKQIRFAAGACAQASCLTAASVER